MFRRGGNSAAFVIDKTRKIHTTFPDGAELVEEYDEESRRLKSRRRRRPTATGAAGSWEALLGDPQPSRQAVTASGAATASGLLLQESNTNPRCVRCDTPGCFTWHISNLHHPADTYNVRVDEEGVALVVSTTNKKYYKRLDMPEMVLLSLVVDPNRLRWDYQAGTLTVHYSKPPALLAEELADAKAAMAMRAEENPAGCRQQ